MVPVVTSTTPELSSAPVSVEGKERKKPARIEKEHHKQAFAYYYALGDNRTLAKVAEEFKVKESLVLNWSSSFEWKKRIAELENRSQEDIFREKAMDLLNLLLDSMARHDEETGKMILTSSEKTTVEKLKLCVDAFKRLRDDAREGDPVDPSLDGEDGRPGRGPQNLAAQKGVMVNFIIKK